MFTIEIDLDETAITIMDDTGELEDVQALLYEDYCHFRQWNEKTNKFEVITLKTEMYLKLMESWKLSDGTYVLEKKKRK